MTTCRIQTTIHATAFLIARDAAAIQPIEAEKTELPADDPRVVGLSATVRGSLGS